MLEDCRDQFISRLRRKAETIERKWSEHFQYMAGMGLSDLADHLETMPISSLRDLMADNERLIKELDVDRPGSEILISEHADSLVSVERGYGASTRPEDYLESFRSYVAEHQDEIPALLPVTRRPRDSRLTIFLYHDSSLFIAVPAILLLVATDTSVDLQRCYNETIPDLDYKGPTHMTTRRQPNLLRELRKALEESPTLNPNQQGGEYQYWLDIGVVLRCLIEDHTDEEILASLESHGYNSSAFGAPVRFLRKVADSTAS